MANQNSYNNIGDAKSDIIKFKQWWQDAYSAGDEAAMKNAQDMAAKAYSWLDMYGGAEGRNVSKQLSQLDYSGAKKWATDGKSQLRNYAYTAGQQYGLSQADIDKYLNYDNATRNISLGGKNLGTPDVVIDGVSYVSDTSGIDNALKNLAKNTNTNLSDRELSSRNSTEVNEKVNDLWGTQQSDRQMMTDKYGRLEEASYANPFTSDEARAIMGKYDLAALQGRDNAVASGGASNGGNIDSYAAANAMRQQAALTNQGQMAVLDAYNNKLSNIRSTLEGLGVYLQDQDAGMQKTIGIQQNEAQRLFENDETAKNNEVDRRVKETDMLATQAEVTGYTPKQWQYANNIYFNADGTLNEKFTSEEFDNTGGFTTIINEAKKKLETTTDATERANLQATINQATVAKAYKTLFDKTGKYAPYLSEVSGITPEITEARRQSEQDDATTRAALDADNAKTAAEVEIAKTNAATEQAIADAANQNTIDQIYAQGEVNKDLMQTEKELAETGGNVKTDENGNVVKVDENGNEENYAPFESWNNSGIALTDVKIKYGDDANYGNTGCDHYGREAIAKAIEAVARGELGRRGIVTNYELADYLITNSSNVHTDKKQLKKVFEYFDLSPALLNNVEDAGKGQNLDGRDFEYGVKYTND